VVGTVAVRQRQGPQQLAHTVWPPALDRIALGKQVADRLAAANEHGPLPQQAGFVDIAVALEAGAGEIRIAKEGKGLEHSALRWRARQGPKGGGIEGHQRHLECSQGCRITVGTASSRPHAAAQNSWLLRTGRRWRGSPGPAQPDRWRQEWIRNGSPAAPGPPKPRAILKDHNHSGLLPLQSFMAAEARRAPAIPAAWASLALLAVRLGLIRTKLIRTRQWRSADRGTGVEIQIVPPDRGDVPIDPSQSA